MDDFVWAAKHAEDINPEACREWVERKYSIDRVKYMFEEYYTKPGDLWKEGWYETHSDRKQLDWPRLLTNFEHEEL
jgi:hypothetical protein